MWSVSRPISSRNSVVNAVVLIGGGGLLSFVPAET